MYNYFLYTAVILSDSGDDNDDNVLGVDDYLQFQQTKKFRKG